MSRTLIEAFDPGKHDRKAFSCGVAAIDNYFKFTAHKLSKAGNVRVFVMTDEDAETLIGFYALNAHAVEYTDLPEAFARDRPRHGNIPAAYISSMIGVDRRFQGRGYGGDLLADALKGILRASEHVAIAVVILDVFDCGDPDQVARRLRLYGRYGFRPLPSNPLRLYLPLATVRKADEQSQTRDEGA